MFFVTRIKKWGGSLALRVDMKTIKTLNLNENDEVEVEIRKKIIVKRYKCSYCGNVFDSDDEPVYCTVCEKEDSVSEFVE